MGRPSTGILAMFWGSSICTAPGFSLCYGHLRLKALTTLVEKKIYFALFQRGAADFVCAAGAEGTFDAGFACSQAASLFGEKKYDECAAFLRKTFPQEYPLSSMFLDVRRKVVNLALRKLDEETDQKFTEIFEREYPVVRGLQLIGAPVPKSFLSVAEFVLSAPIPWRALKRAVQWPLLNLFTVSYSELMLTANNRR